MPYSDAVAIAIICLENYLSHDIPMDFDVKVEDMEFRDFLDNIRNSIKQLTFTEKLLDLASERPDLSKFRSTLAWLAGDEAVFEYFAGLHALDTLYRIEDAKERILDVIRLLPVAQPPARSQRYLERIVDCFLAGLDEEAIVMSRAVVEVLAEERWGERPERPNLGAMIRTLKKDREITAAQAHDMWEINEQAREVIHDEPSARRINALDCVRRVARLLEQLHPVSS